MSENLVTTTPDVPIAAAGTTLLEEAVGSVLVLDDEDELVGILTSTDFVDLVSTDGATDATVASYMTDEVVTVGVDDSVRDAAAKMISEDIQHLPVEGDEGVVGMLSATDLTEHLSYIDA
ncbi:CBS domain-containing protein [Haloarcula sediminis]|uniref:CBS domain-containing protein n=1 Tax=Haloarcula sediminis TaxID=3111777 RepID=UPI002D79E732|nr:CBS domain-containing protein [Haloarcula sp. CK38]